MTDLETALEDIESFAAHILDAEDMDEIEANAHEITDRARAVRDALGSGDLTHPTVANGEGASPDPEMFPDAPLAGVPVYVTVAMQDSVWRFTAAGDLLTASDVPAHVYGALEGWKRRGGYNDADYVHDVALTDGSEPPVLTVPVGTLRHLLQMAEQAYPEAEEEDCIETARTLLGNG